MLLDCGATAAGTLDRAVVLSLHAKGLVWLDVPVAGDDCVALTSLEGFVMNRVKWAGERVVVVCVCACAWCSDVGVLGATSWSGCCTKSS